MTNDTTADQTEGLDVEGAEDFDADLSRLLDQVAVAEDALAQAQVAVASVREAVERRAIDR